MANKNDSAQPEVPLRRDFNLLKVGSRRSQLAMIQTNFVISELSKQNPELKFEVQTMVTTGDAILDQPLAKIGTKSLFTGELEQALSEGSVDLVVHSMKDMPTQLPDGLVIGCVTKRQSPYDAFVAKKNSEFNTMAELPLGSVIGTSSLRRIAQLRRAYPDLEFADIRGNLNTRLRKLDEGSMYSGLVLAEAGISRMGWQDRCTQLLDTNICAYAVGQGALAVECRVSDKRVMGLLKALTDEMTFYRCVTERTYLRTLEGGCSVPVACESEIFTEEKKKSLRLTGRVLPIDGSVCLEFTKTVDLPTDAEDGEADSDPSAGDVPVAAKRARLSQAADYVGLSIHDPQQLELRCQSVAYQLGKDVAADLLKQGAKNILDQARKETEAGVAAAKAAKAAIAAGVGASNSAVNS